LDGVGGAVDDRPPDFDEALAKGLSIHECFDAGHGEMTLSEIARRVSLTPAAARRSLITLITLGYVGQANKRFFLRPKVLGLGSAFYFSARIGDLLQPELQRLVEQFGDASSIATLDQADVIYVAHYSVQRARRATAVVGARYPAHATSLGRVLLAGLGDAELDAYLAMAKLEPLTSKTLTDKEALRREILAVRERNYSTTVDQLDYGITALAVPIRGPNGATAAALNSSGYSGLITPGELVENRLAELQAAAARIALTMSRYPILGSIIASI
jgi:IclR family pca regulon transcriptional regulator